MLKIAWLPSAVNDLAQILSYISERSPQAARNIRQLIESAVLPVAEHPYLYRNGRVSGTREIVAHPNYIIVYRVTATDIEIINILHARQQYPE
ncbi:MAG TPA: type II toxin-antitoxin system RelE/ParE family toxin [Pusillimonas sp.]|uniref:type II toxin-antitoxin system RelE/ParE family toxin n=1 Tax=Pusillimonas sp. TaxID=3040095 RepID=UPI002C305364|nr:type II toxin-antitoxin system RelE/ParE family toxin [Pusillimonas sp.]HUH87904.1 type II toxin-antitoxin system RelE/ParE family toxin [Pusillimonas sp.]